MKIHEKLTRSQSNSKSELSMWKFPRYIQSVRYWNKNIPKSKIPRSIFFLFKLHRTRFSTISRSQNYWKFHDEKIPSNWPPVKRNKTKEMFRKILFCLQFQRGDFEIFEKNFNFTATNFHKYSSKLFIVSRVCNSVEVCDEKLRAHRFDRSRISSRNRRCSISSGLSVRGRISRTTKIDLHRRTPLQREALSSINTIRPTLRFAF